jgi:putative Holliday junction resolvase
MNLVAEQSNQHRLVVRQILTAHKVSQGVMSRVNLSALGLDLGKKRIGVSGCDGTGLIATGLTTIIRRSFIEDVALLHDLATERQVQVLVIGMPYTLNGDVGTQAKQTRRLAQRFGTALHLPIEYVDERLTSHQAEQLLLAEGRSPSRHRDLIDRKAAAIILQQWLDQRRATLPDPFNTARSFDDGT